MKLFLISQEVNDDYDTYDSAVVCANDEDEARHMHPCDNHKYMSSSWCAPEHVQVQYIGEAADDIKVGVVCASYNAG